MNIDVSVTNGDRSTRTYAAVIEMQDKDRRWTFSIRELMMDFVFVAIGVGLIRLSIDEQIARGSFPNVNLAILGSGSLIGIPFFHCLRASTPTRLLASYLLGVIVAVILAVILIGGGFI
jgi:hypothetical protein